MSIFVPFKAFRPTPETVEKVASKPYDVLNAAEAREEAAGNALSFYHVIKPEIDFPDGYDAHTPEVHAKGRENLKHLIDSGVLIQDDQDSFYVYEITMGKHVQTGLVGCSGVDDYFNNIIKKHESTKPATEADRMQHILKSKFNYEPVFFSYSPVSDIDTIVLQAKKATPLYDLTTEDGVRHVLWRITEAPIVQRISQLFAEEVHTVYIADGHHRTAAGALAGRALREQANGDDHHHFSYLMSVLVPEDQVNIIDYNRVVKDLNGHSPESFLEAISSAFLVEAEDQQYRPESHQKIGMYLNGQWYQLTARQGTYDAADFVESMGFSILSRQILEPILNIVDLRRDKRVAFVGGIRGLAELEKRVNSGEMQVAFAMHPISMAQIMHISDNDLKMPPKITWFEPKLRSGLFLHSLTDV